MEFRNLEGLCFLGDAGEKGLDTSINFCRGEVGIAEPDERHSQLFTVEQMLVMAIGLTQLTFYAVAIDGMLEMLLGNGY